MPTTYIHSHRNTHTHTNKQWHTQTMAHTNTHTHTQIRTHTHHDDKTSRNRMITWKGFVKFIKFGQHAFNFYIVVYFQFHNLKLKLG